jgi:cytochrome c biogenesis protein CcmG, thiol:disulfide interchange protein DsbE
MRVKQKTETGKLLWTPMRLAFTVVVLSLVAAFGISSCSSGDEKRAESPGGTSGAKSPPSVKNAPANPPASALITTLPANIVDAELKAASGAPIKLSNYNGKVLLVNLWATWCGPCRLETPELVKLYNEFRSQGVEIIGLSTENPETSAESVRKFINEYNVNYRIGWATPEVAITLMQGRDAIPQSFVIARDGRVIRRFVGFNPISVPPQIKEAIQEALNSKSAAD